MSQQKEQTITPDPLLHAKSIWDKYQKPIGIALAVVILVIGGWYAYDNFVVKPKEADAQNAIFRAEKYFQQDSLKLALNGDGQNKGFLYIISNYGGTKEGNLAKYYAGVCYLRTGDFNNAVKYLNDFHTDAKQIQMMAYGCLGDAYSELKKDNEAVDSYKKASSTFEEDETIAPEFLFRAALKLETMGKTAEAVDLYKQLKEKFPTSERGYAADKYINRLSVQANDFSVK